MRADREPGAELWVLFDGVGWKYAQENRFLDWLPFRRPLSTVLGYSSTAIPSLLSGFTPREHGAWTLYFRSPESSPFAWTRPFAWLPLERIPKLRWRFRNWMQARTVRLHAIEGYFALYEVPLKYRYLFDVAWRDGLFGERCPLPTFIDLWRQHVPGPFVGAHPDSDSTIRKHAQMAITEGTRRFFCYFADLDGLLHQYAKTPTHRILETAFREADSWVKEQALELESRYGSVSVVVFSDHGMTPVSRTLDLRYAVRDLRLGRDYLCFLDATLARFWGARDSLELIAGRLDGAPGRLLTRDSFDTERLPYDPARFGDLVWLADPGVCIEPNWMGSIAPAGMHGYSPADPWSDGIVMTNDSRYADANDVVELGRALVSSAGSYRR